MTGWHIHDRHGLHRYTFKAFTLCAGKTVRIHTGSGSDGSANKYWGEGNYIWNNTGDTATLTGPKGSVVDVCKYSDATTSHSQVPC